MRSENQEIRLSGDEALELIRVLSFVVVSLDQIGSAANAGAIDLGDTTVDFIEKGRVPQKLSAIRAVIQSKFNLELGEDDMDDLERALGIPPTNPMTPLKIDA